MPDSDVSLEQLLAENAALRDRVTALETALITYSLAPPQPPVVNPYDPIDTTNRAALQSAILKLREDITQPTQANDAAWPTTEALNRRLVDALPGGIVWLSASGDIMRANAEAQHVLDLTYDPPTQRFLSDFTSRLIDEDGRPWPLDDHTDFCSWALLELQPGQTLGLHRPDGSLTWAIFTSIPVRDPRTEVSSGAIITFRDITEQKTAEDERKRLEHQLRQSHKMEAIGTLASGIAHEFNNALSAILGFTDLTQRQLQQGSNAWSYLHEVMKAGHRAKDLVQQILAFSRQEALDRTSLRLAAVIHQTLPLLRASLPATIELHTPDLETPGTVFANVTQLQQILMNLCSNAEHAMRAQQGILHINVTPVTISDSSSATGLSVEPGPYVSLSVLDNGIGMSPEVVEHIFDPFFTTKEVGEGTGMGLAIVHGIVTSYGGAISVQSAPGEGTEFTILLPRIQEAPVAEIGIPQDSVQPGQGRILFVDDEEMLARLGEGLLTYLGYEVVTYTSSPEALRGFRADPNGFDLVITDQTMPMMTGETLVGALRRIRPDIPIILCTGYSHRINAEKAQALGVDAFVMKPGVTQELALSIQRVLTKRAGLTTS